MREARRFILAFYGRKRKDVQVAKVLKENRQHFEQASLALGVPLADAQKPSLRAAMAAEEDGELTDPMIRQGFSWRSCMLIAAALCWCIYMKANKDKVAAFSLLSAILRGTCGAHVVHSATLRGHMRVSRHTCPGFVHGDDLCPHQQLCLESALRHGDPWEVCAALLRELFAVRLACPAAGATLGRIVWFLELHMQEYLERTPATPARKVELLMGSSRKRRFDEDYKISIAEDITKGKVLSANAVGQNTGDFSMGTSYGWRLQELAGKLAAAWAQYETSEVISICQDGVKAGNPQEETDCYLVWDATHDNGFVLAPQVALIWGRPSPRALGGAIWVGDLGGQRSGRPFPSICLWLRCFANGNTWESLSGIMMAGLSGKSGISGISLCEIPEFPDFVCLQFESRTPPFSKIRKFRNFVFRDSESIGGAE